MRGRWSVRLRDYILIFFSLFSFVFLSLVLFLASPLWCDWGYKLPLAALYSFPTKHKLKAKFDCVYWIVWHTLSRWRGGFSLFSCFCQVTIVLWLIYLDLAARLLNGQQTREEDDGTGWAAELLRHRSRLSAPRDVTLPSSKPGLGAPLWTGRFLILFSLQVDLIHSRCTRV